MNTNPAADTERLCKQLENRSIWVAPVTPAVLDETIAHMRALQTALDTERAEHEKTKARITAALFSLCTATPRQANGPLYRAIADLIGGSVDDAQAWMNGNSI